MTIGGLIAIYLAKVYDDKVQVMESIVVVDVENTEYDLSPSSKGGQATSSKKYYHPLDSNIYTISNTRLRRVGFQANFLYPRVPIHVNNNTALNFTKPEVWRIDILRGFVSGKEEDYCHEGGEEDTCSSPSSSSLTAVSSFIETTSNPKLLSLFKTESSKESNRITLPDWANHFQNFSYPNNNDEENDNNINTRGRDWKDDLNLALESNLTKGFIVVSDGSDNVDSRNVIHFDNLMIEYLVGEPPTDNTSFYPPLFSSGNGDIIFFVVNGAFSIRVETITVSTVSSEEEETKLLTATYKTATTKEEYCTISSGSSFYYPFRRGRNLKRRRARKEEETEVDEKNFETVKYRIEIEGLVPGSVMFGFAGSDRGGNVQSPSFD